MSSRKSPPHTHHRRLLSRADFSRAERIVIKAGTGVVSSDDGFPSLVRIANIVESAAKLVRAGKQVLIVSSGAVGIGRRKLRHQLLSRQSLADVLRGQHTEGAALPASVPRAATASSISYNSACAAAGQMGLVSLYETMFTQFDLSTSQLLVTAFDFTSEERKNNLQYVIEELLSLGVVPIINENDAVTGNKGYETCGELFSDNDSLASLVAQLSDAQLMVLLTDVDGVYTCNPKLPNARLIDVLEKHHVVEIGEKSLYGRGGMGSKINAMFAAVDQGVDAVVIASGRQQTVVDQIIAGESVGTVTFRGPESDDDAPGSTSTSSSSGASSPRAVAGGGGGGAEAAAASASGLPLDAVAMAEAARDCGRQLKQVPTAVRNAILLRIAAELERAEAEILAVNAEDVAAAKANDVAPVLLSRLKLTHAKLASLVDGVRSIAQQDEPLGKLHARTRLARGLTLDRISTPIGVLLVIFESRPDCLPQIAALAIRSGNGVVLKGGKEAVRTNAFLHGLVAAAIHDASEGAVGAGAVGFLRGREEIPALLKLDQYIDLVIPRGGNALVKYIKENTTIPVMGHADGICHVYVDAAADVKKATRIVVDAKTNYPSACNALETLLLHHSLIDSGAADVVMRSLRTAGVQLVGGPRAIKEGLLGTAAQDMHTEYGDLRMAVEVVGDLHEAVAHIHAHGSGHTEAIVTEDAGAAEKFLAAVDSACVFHNASTRFADGYRFGLGAEVGIATGRLHARGPVGVQGLLTYKWQLRSDSAHTVGDFSPDAPDDVRQTFTHEPLPVS